MRSAEAFAAGMAIKVYEPDPALWRFYGPGLSAREYFVPAGSVEVRELAGLPCAPLADVVKRG